MLVLPVCELQVDGLLAIGLGDNSVALWDLTENVFVTRVNSPGLMSIHFAPKNPNYILCGKFCIDAYFWRACLMQRSAFCTQ